MRTLLLALLTIVVGVALGAGVAVLRIKARPWNPKLDEGVETAAAAGRSPHGGSAPKAVIDKAEYDFGTRFVEASSGSHEFVVANKGGGPLSLTVETPSSPALVSSVGEEKIAPGESAKVTIAWKAAESPGPFHETAKIRTNDPDQREITLTILGQVTPTVSFSPPGLVFNRLPVDETLTAESRLFCYRATPLRILGHTWSDAATARYFEVTQRPLEAAELQEEPTARSGLLVKVTLKAGMPPGPIHQELVFQTNTPTSPTLPIVGATGSDISVIGPGWDPDLGILQLGAVVRSQGAHRRLMLVVRGPMRKDVTFKLLSVDPSVMRASLGKPVAISHGTAVQVPLTIDIPPGSPPVSRLGTGQGKLGEVILETTHSQTPKMRIPVRFAIEG